MANSNFHAVVKLLRNHLYPTYQLYAQMASKKLTPEQGLKLGALTVLAWLRLRLGDAVPKELQTPEPEQYAAFPLEQLASIHVNYGFVIDVIALPDKGLWTMQITEPDLGSDPGNPQQHRKPVAGRIIETNVAFAINGQELEVGVQTVISDPENTALAEVYRPAFVKKLYNHPDFGLKQVLPLLPKYRVINQQDKLERLLELYHNQHNQLPCIIFTKVPKAVDEGLPLEGLRLEQLEKKMSYDEQGNRLHPIVVEHELVDKLATKAKNKERPKAQAEDKPDKPIVCKNLEELRILARNPLAQQKSTVLRKAVQQRLEYVIPEYNIKRWAASFTGFAHVYLLEPALLEKLCHKEQLTAQAGDIIILEPQAFKGGKIVLPIDQRAQNEAALMQLIFTYPREKQIDFGNLYFLSGARDALVNSSKEAKQSTSKQAERFAVEQKLKDTQWQVKILEKDRLLAQQENQLHKQAQQINVLEQQLAEQKQQQQLQNEKKLKQLAEKEAYISFLQKRLARPHSKKELPRWAEENLQPHLVLLPRAVDGLEAASFTESRLELLYDALEYLANDYWESRYQGLEETELHKRASLKYQRGFNVTPNSDSSIASYPQQYKITGYKNKQGSTVTRALDYHLKAGNKAEHLVRIYFFFDDERQQIVVGSLPEHLDTVRF